MLVTVLSEIMFVIGKTVTSSPIPISMKYESSCTCASKDNVYASGTGMLYLKGNESALQNILCANL